MSENLIEIKGGGGEDNLPFSCFLDLNINYLLEVSGIHITVFIYCVSFSRGESLTPCGAKGNDLSE